MGVVLVVILIVIAYILALIWLIKEKCIKEFVNNIITPGFLVFLIFFISLGYFNYGKMVSSGDEFSHWADIVKVMVYWDDFGTNPNAHSLLPSYPPGMALFQYFLQKIYIWTSGNSFSEWRLYVAFQIFLFAWMMPFLREMHFKKIILTLASALTIFLCPLLFYDTVYSRICIDPVLGILAGAGYAMIFLYKKDVFCSLQILSTCMMLVLIKDAGMLFAVFLALTYALVFIWENREYLKRGVFAKWWICIILPWVAVCLPRFLWSHHLKVKEANIRFSAPIDIGKLISIITGNDTSWQGVVWKNYYQKLITQTLPIGNTNILLNYPAIAVLFLGVILALYSYVERKEYKVFKVRLLVGSMTALFFIYVVGLCIVYIFKFIEYDALRLTSFSRYINIVYLAMWVFIVILLLRILQNSHKVLEMAFILSGFMILVSPIEHVYSFMHGDYIAYSKSFRKPYESISAAIDNYVPDKSNVYYISQESSGLDQLVIAYNVRKKGLDISGGSIGEPFYEGDIWTILMDVDMWHHQLMENYDYVVLYKINDYFVENFSDIFEDKNEIVNEAIYRLNKQTGLLERCN